jgi:predicted GIY-YIG superfamily endonuclease
MKKFTISQYNFDTELEQQIILNHRDYLSWPLVYFLNDNHSKDAYVGETTDVLNRMKAHSKTERKNKLASVNLILSDYFNKSATLDLEANLIRYIADFGSNYTIKEYSSKKTTSEDGWKHQEITLLPKSNLPYDPIVLRDEETIGLKVVGIFVKVLTVQN